MQLSTRLALSTSVLVFLADFGSTQEVTNLAKLRSIDLTFGGDANQPFSATSTKDGELLYVATLSSSGGEDGGRLLVIDTRTEQIIGEFEITAGGQQNLGFVGQVVLAPAEDRVYVAVSKASGSNQGTGSSRVEVLDVGNPMAPMRIDTYPDPNTSPLGDLFLATTPDGGRVYVTSRGNQVVRSIDTQSGVPTNIVVGGTPMGIGVLPDGSEAWTARRNDASIVVIDTQSNAVDGTVQTSLSPSTNTLYVCIAADGNTAYVTSTTDNRVAVVDTQARAEIDLIDTMASGGLFAMAKSPDDRWLYVNSGSDSETVVIDIDPTSGTLHQVVHRIGVAPSPFGAIASQSRAGCTSIYVGASNNSAMEVIGSAPTAYCSAKSILVCGPPSIDSSGLPSASANSGFVIEARPARSNKSGLFIYSDRGRASLPFQGGTLCLAPPLSRSVPVSSGGSSACDGRFAIDWNAFARGLLGGNPQSYLSVPGQRVNVQVWGRDSIATGSFLSNALEFAVCL